MERAPEHGFGKDAVGAEDRHLAESMTEIVVNWHMTEILDYCKIINHSKHQALIDVEWMDFFYTSGAMSSFEFRPGFASSPIAGSPAARKAQLCIGGESQMEAARKPLMEEDTPTTSLPAALEKEAANLFFCSNCKAHSWQDRAEFQECCGHPQVENIAIRKPLKLPNEPLPIQFCGSPRSQRYNAAYTTTIYDFQGEIVGLPDKYCFQFKELWLKVADRDGSSQLNAPSETSLQTPVTPAAAASPDPSDDDSSDEDAPNLWYVYVRFFTKFSNLETLIRAMWPAMFHSIDVYNSLTFIARAQLATQETARVTSHVWPIFLE
eukprot:Skav202865  [mRNA]  locus=scaffold3206:177477:188560:- [translate_table: standard]